MNKSNILETGMPLRREVPQVCKFDSAIPSAGFLYECQSSTVIAAALLSFKQYPLTAVAAALAERLSNIASLWLVFRQKYSLGEHIGLLSLPAERVC